MGRAHAHGRGRSGRGGGNNINGNGNNNSTSNAGKGNGGNGGNGSKTEATPSRSQTGRSLREGRQPRGKHVMSVQSTPRPPPYRIRDRPRPCCDVHAPRGARVRGERVGESFARTALACDGAEL